MVIVKLKLTAPFHPITISLYHEAELIPCRKLVFTAEYIITNKAEAGNIAPKKIILTLSCQKSIIPLTDICLSQKRSYQSIRGFDDMERKKVKSTLIKSVGYDDVSLVLEIEFQNKEVGRYLNVTKQTYENMMKSPSVGSYFIQFISKDYPNRFVRVKKKKFSIL